MSKCPSCFRPLMQDKYLYECVSGKCVAEPDPTATSFYGAARATAEMTVREKPADAKRWAPGVVTCHRCTGATREICVTCHYPVPQRWRDGIVTCLTMAGARATGKSMYIAVMIKQIARMCELMGSTMSPWTDATAKNFPALYERQVYEARGVLTSTASASSGGGVHEPLVYSLGTVDGAHRFLAIRDVAGEDMEAGLSTPNLSFVGFADGVFFLVDPLRIEEVRDTLHGVIPVQEQVGGDPLAVLTSVIRAMGTSNVKLGVVLSKFDALQALEKVQSPRWQPLMANVGAAFRRDPDPTGWRADPHDGELLHEEVRSLLHLLGAQSLLHALANPAGRGPIPHRFFAVSALGSSPDGAHLHEAGIAPFRCLDPVRWAMS